MDQEAKKCEWCLLVDARPKGRFCSTLCKNRFISSKNDYTKIAEKLSKEKIAICCLCCNQNFYVDEHIAKEQKCCSRSCSAKINNSKRTEEVYQKQSKTLKEKYATGLLKLPTPPKNTVKQIYNKNCLFCKKDFVVLGSHKKQQYCSVVCTPQHQAKLNPKDKLAQYRRECNFQFALNSYPDKFDFSLIEKHGWYSPSNKNNNLGGVSRDHKFSVREGFEKNVSPEIMRHPANCELMIHNENISKNCNSSITLEQLLNQIKIWDENKINNSS